MEAFSLLSSLKDCIGNCLDDKQPININITIHNDREYFSQSRPREARPEYTRQIARKRAYSVG